MKWRLQQRVDNIRFVDPGTLMVQLAGGSCKGSKQSQEGQRWNQTSISSQIDICCRKWSPFICFSQSAQNILLLVSSCEKTSTKEWQNGTKEHGPAICFSLTSVIHTRDLFHIVKRFIQMFKGQKQNLPRAVMRQQQIWILKALFVC